jgi:hypothetical protein
VKEVVQRAGNYVGRCLPSLSASLENLKYVACTNLPTQFVEARMDMFGAHGYYRPQVGAEDPGRPRKGAHLANGGWRMSYRWEDRRQEEHITALRRLLEYMSNFQVL